VAVGGGSKVTALGLWASIQSDCMGDGPNEHVQYIRKRQKAEWSLFLVILVLKLMSNDPFI
jgi:hypothetical protein